MGKLDPQLEFLVDGGVAVVEDTNSLAEVERYGIRRMAKKRGTESRPPPRVEILVQFAGDIAELENVGMTVRSVAGDVISGTISIDAISALAEIAAVERVESSRAMYPELDLAIIDTNVDDVHTGPPGRRGAGVIVGIVDTGTDYTHPSFRRANGTSRILSLWDQGLTRQTGETSPAGFGYGVDYGNVVLNNALNAADPFTVVRHRDTNAHGTHVSGIAAGDGSAAGQGRAGSTFLGVAPEADIIVVANASNGNEGIGTSASTLDAVNYIFQRAQALNRPAVINMSLGDNLGPHDGTSLLERGLDNLLGGAGRAFVKSAGNAGTDGIHAQGTVIAGATVNLRFNQPSDDASTNQIDVWYDGADTFRVSVVDPAGNVVGPVNVNAATTFTLPGGNAVRVDHRNNDVFNGDKRIFFTFSRGTSTTLTAGNWTIRFVGVTSPSGGRFDAWIQRGQDIPRFLAPHESSARTISTPGTAREIITAASYVTRGAGVGSLSSFSSLGPTRDGRQAPTLAAPGQAIISARAHFATENPPRDPYSQMSGTSMAAPHVTGVIALMLQRTPTLTAAQIATKLRNSARSDTFTGPVPNTAWGAGKIDAKGAVGAGVIIPPSVLAGCPSAIAVCPSVVCPVSVPSLNCPIRSVVAACAPSVPTLTCPSVLCPRSVPTIGCPSPSVPLATCPVASVPAGCPIDPTVIATVITNPVLRHHEQADAGTETTGPEPAHEPPRPLPDQGFYDYDDTWFD